MAFTPTLTLRHQRGREGWDDSLRISDQEPPLAKQNRCNTIIAPERIYEVNEE
jgi:hypothetical protein